MSLNFEYILFIAILKRITAISPWFLKINERKQEQDCLSLTSHYVFRIISKWCSFYELWDLLIHGVVSAVRLQRNPTHTLF